MRQSDDKADDKSAYLSPPTQIRISWFDPDQPLRGSCECEVSRLLPQAVFKFTVEEPDEGRGWDSPYWSFFITTDPDAHRFGVWQKVEDQPWSSEFAWTPEQLDVDESDPVCALEDLSDALSDGDAHRAFSAFARLRGGCVEILEPGSGPPTPIP